MSLLSISRKKDKATPARASIDFIEGQVAITSAAATAIKEWCEKENGTLLRVGIRGGGCSGLSYLYEVVAEFKETDTVFEKDGQSICVDPKSLKVLAGTALDFLQETGKSGFIIRNPDAKGTCSCGQSFALS